MSYKVLVVDDEPDLEPLIRQTFRRQVRSRELDFVFARNGIEALETLEECDDVDLVLTDINMPEMDGLTLLLKLAERKSLLKAVIVSAYGDLDNIRVAMNRGAADFLTKPIDLQDLEVTIEKTLKDVVTLRDALKARDQLVTIRHELEIASSIQQSILPRTFPPFPDRAEFDVFAEMLPAREVGGDLYDFFLIDRDRLGFLVGDVSGKGVPAAIFMAVSRTMLKSTALLGLSPGECLERVNGLLCLENSTEMFVTIFYGILDLRTGDIEYANGGHNPPFVVRASGAVALLPTTGGTVLGVLPGLRYATAKTRLASGETILVYSDGVTEAMDEGGRLFSDQRLQELLAGADRSSPQALVRAVVEDVRRHAAGAPQSDDITTLAIRYAG